MKLKVYGGCYDGRNRVIVAAKSKKEAHALVNSAIGISYYSWDAYTSTTGNDNELTVALGAPGTVFSAPHDYRDNQFVALAPSR